MGRGAFLPHGEGREWVDSEVLRRLRRRSVARLRRQVEAVDAAAYARFCTGWHGIGEGAASPEDLLDTIGRLQGAAVPASILEDEVLPARLDYRPALLDALAAAGEVVWVGRGPLGPGDGRVALYLRPLVGALHWPLDLPAPDGEAHRRLRAHLQARGASFFPDLYAAAGGGDPQAVLDALWDLVWAGEVTNDTLAPLALPRAGQGPPPGGPGLPALRHSARREPAAGTWSPTSSPPPLPPRRPPPPGQSNCSPGTGSWAARRCWPRASPGASPASTRCSPPSRRPAGCAGATSSRASAGPSSPFPAPSTACAPGAVLRAW